MNKLLIAAALLSSVSVPVLAQDLNPQPLPPAEMYASDVVGDFYFSLEAIAIGRSATNTVLGYDDTTGPNVNFSTRDLGGPLGYAGGMQFTFGARLDGVWGVELHGMGAGNFTSSGERTATGENLYAAYTSSFTPGNLFFQNSDVAYGARFSESSSIGSIGANATYDMGDFKLFFGPRVIRYQANLDTTYFDEIDDYQGTDDGIDRVSISSTNTLVGAQVGVSGMYDINDMFSVGGRAAVGLYANYATLNRSYDAGTSGNSPFATPSVSSTSSATGFAQSFEISPKINVAVTENLDLSLGTTWLWLNGVDEPGTHYAGIGAPGGGGGLAADSPTFSNGVNFGGITAGLHGQF